MMRLTNLTVRYRKEILFVLVAIILVVTRFVPISFGDLYGDNAINSFRAYGWLDYLGASGQTTPFQWLGHIPGWAMLSFHDAPPLAFLVQRIFFAILGGGTVMAKLPFVLAGIASIWLVYCLVRRLTDEKTAWIATIAYTVSSYAAWASQAIYLEGILEPFVAGCVLIGAVYLFKEQKSKYLYLWIIFLALSSLTKYTAIFLIPPILLYAFLCRRELKKQWKHLIFAAVIFLVLLSPLIIYNAILYQTRGHFDAALSSMVGIESNDFLILSGRTAHYNVIQNTIEIFKTFATNASYPFVILFVVCLVGLTWKSYRTGLRSLESWILINTVSLFLILGFIGGKVRFSSIIVPFVAIVIGLGAVYIYGLIKTRKLKSFYVIVILAVFVFELTYAVNTNVLYEPITTSPWFYSENKIKSLGFNQVDDFIRRNVIVKLPPKNHIKTEDDMAYSSDEDVKGHSIVIFDDRVIWQSSLWYFQRYLLYYRWPVISTYYLSEMNKVAISIEDMINASGKTLYFIYPIDYMVMDPVRVADERLNSLGPDLAKRFDAMSATSTIIENKNGVPTFKVYRVDRI